MEASLTQMAPLLQREEAPGSCVCQGCQRLVGGMFHSHVQKGQESGSCSVFLCSVHKTDRLMHLGLVLGSHKIPKELFFSWNPEQVDSNTSEGMPQPQDR